MLGGGSCVKARPLPSAPLWEGGQEGRLPSAQQALEKQRRQFPWMLSVGSASGGERLSGFLQHERFQRAPERKSSTQ